ncbi:hypothetical protein BKA93DRAFT_820633 [Sparassis latifolia]
MMAMQAFSDGLNYQIVGESVKEDIRAGALKALLMLPYIINHWCTPRIGTDNQQYEWIKELKTSSARCHDCNRWIQLRVDREYDEANWKVHKSKCPQITGLTTKHVQVAAAKKTSSNLWEVKIEVPVDGNKHMPEYCWTDAERKKLDFTLKAWAQWQVDYHEGFVCSAQCKGTTENTSEVCQVFTLAIFCMSSDWHIHQANSKANLPDDQQHTIHVAHENCFLQLYQHTKEGKLSNHETFMDICAVLTDRVHRDFDDNQKLKNGMCYPQNYLNFMTLMHSYGQNSAQQYGILTSQIGGLSPRLLRYVISRSPDCLQKPFLDFENMARVKHLVDSIHYTGLVAIAGDCTKVQQRLTYSNDFSSHILGSVLSMEECLVDNPEAIEGVINHIKSKKAMAMQTRVILIKVPLPQIPPLVVTLISTDGTDNVELIHTQHMQMLAMAAQLKILVISCAADGAASEVAAQGMMDNVASELPHLSYAYTLYGVELKAPVFKQTGPLMSVTDPLHARKTARNQPQHGTHTASCGEGYIVDHSLIDLYEASDFGLVLHDVENVDKQDDGAARRMFHYVALTAATDTNNNQRTVKDGFSGIFLVEHFFGLARTLLPNFTYAELLKLIKHVMLHQQILLSGHFKAKKDFQLTNEDMNNLVVLAFKEASQICKQVLRITALSLPITLAPFVASSQNARRKGPKIQDAVFDNESSNDSDSDEDDGDPDDTAGPESNYEESLSELEKRPSDDVCLPDITVALPAATSASPTSGSISNPVLCSEIFDNGDKISISAMLALRKWHQSGTMTRSEQVVVIDPKFVLCRLKDVEAGLLGKMSVHKASHCVRIVQALHATNTRTKTTRELCWQSTTKEVQRILSNNGIIIYSNFQMSQARM